MHYPGQETYCGCSPLAISIGEVTPGLPLLQAALLSSAPGEAAWSLLGALTDAEGASGVALLEETFPTPKVLEVVLLCCSPRVRLLESFVSAGTGMLGSSLDVGLRCLVD